MKLGFFILFFSVFLSLQAQKTINRTLDGQGVSTVYIDGKDCFKVQAHTSKTSTITLDAKIEGEHFSDLMVIARQSHDTLFVASKFQPVFSPDNDKLSAHKLISVEINLELPEDLNLYITSEITQFTAQGVYNNIFAELHQGLCNLFKFTGNATVNTVKAPITVQSNFARIDAYSRLGKVKLERLTSGNHVIDLKSVHGDITVFKTE